MDRNHRIRDDQPRGVETPLDMSLEQREHLKENRRRNEEPIDERKTDGSNIPST